MANWVTQEAAVVVSLREVSSALGLAIPTNCRVESSPLN